MLATTHDAVWSGDDHSSTSRRQHAREALTWALVYVEFGQDNGGIALNLSEDGISVQAAMPLAGDSFPEMRLMGGPDSGWTEVTGRLVWINDTRKTAGIQFVDLSDHARSRIAGWIALERAPQGAMPLPRSDARQTPNRTAFNRGLHAGDAEQIAQIASRRVGRGEKDRGPDAKSPPSAASDSNAPSSRSSNQQIGNPKGASFATDPSARGLNDINAIPGNRLFGSQTPAASPMMQKHWYRPRPPRARLIPANWNVGFYSSVLLLVGMTFATGLVLGSGDLGRFSKSANKPPSQQDDLGTTANAKPVKAPDDQTSALAAPDNSLAKLLSPPPSVLEPGKPSPLAQSSAEGLPRGASDKRFETATAPKRKPQSDPITPGASAEPASVHPATPVLQPSLPVAANSTVGRSEAVPEKPVERPGASPPSSFGSVQTQPVQPSAQSVATATAPPSDAARSQTDLRAASVLNVAETTPSSKVDPVAMTSHAAEAPPEGHHVPPVASPGHMDSGHLIHSVQPVYPADAKKQHLEGNVKLRLVVGADGNVRSIQLVSGAPMLAPAAISAARQFRYAPALLNGQPIETIQTIDMSFSLKN